jgi:hypothetical protein
MCDNGEEYEKEIKELIERKFGGPTEYLSDPKTLVGRWTFRFSNGVTGTHEFNSNGTSRSWLDRDGESKAPVERWALKPKGWLIQSQERGSAWYEDLWRLYRFNDDRFVLANEDASVKLEYNRAKPAAR